MRTPCLLLAASLLAACNGNDPSADCTDAEKVTAYTDADGDGFGAASEGLVCLIGTGQAAVGGDCDDANPDANPTGLETCDGIDTDCDSQVDNGFNTTDFYPDSDGDAFGDDASPTAACVAPPGFVEEGGDCDDTNGDVNPARAEICNDGVPLDDDCDGLTDDEDDGIVVDTQTDWYPDADADGFGKNGNFQSACVAPSSTVVADNTDCDDTNPDRNPAAPEVCDGVDNNCDMLGDDDDPTVDPATFIDLFVDADMDGAGDPTMIVKACAPAPGVGVANGDDCDDTDNAIGPSRPETTCDTIDNDCDPLTLDNPDQDVDGFLRCEGDCDDTRAAVNPDAFEIPSDGVDSNCNLLESCYQDVDADGSRTSVGVEGSDFDCNLPPNTLPNRPLDCDDTDETITWSGDWEADEDQDGVGNGVIVLTGVCPDPGPGFVLPGGDLDCDDSDETTFPGADDPCNDGFDSDCDALDTCRTCLEWLESDPASVSATYAIRGNAGLDRQVWCDMDIDGGGWTLVAASGMAALDDAAGGYHNDLADLTVSNPHTNVWNGLRTIADTGDMRFACKLLSADTDYAVDMSFYDVGWYGTITEGTDADSCFNPDGTPDPTPARRNNLDGTFLSSSNPWNSGALVGEDTCNDVDDFTVDFDDRGMNGNTADGTDWGNADGKVRCTEAALGESWFLFARE